MFQQTQFSPTNSGQSVTTEKANFLGNGRVKQLLLVLQFIFKIENEDCETNFR